MTEEERVKELHRLARLDYEKFHSPENREEYNRVMGNIGVNLGFTEEGGNAE